MFPERSKSRLTLKTYMHKSKKTISTFQIQSKKAVSMQQIWNNSLKVSICQIQNQILQ